MRVTHVRDRLERVPAPVVDAVLAAATAVAIAIAIAALLLARRRRPLAVFLASAALVIAYHALEYPAIGLVAPLAPALYTAARAGHFRPVVAVIVTLELFALGWRARGEGEPLVSALGSQTLVEGLLAVVLLLLAEAVRTRRAWMEEVAERLRRTETEREREAERRVEQERLRIARELHDVLAHTIAVIAVQAGVAAETLADAPDAARTALRTIREQTREATAELRAAIGVLREPRGDAPTEPAPGLAQLQDLVGATVPQLSVSVSVAGAPRPLPTAVDLTAYRIVQESLTNVLRHADASEAKVAIRYEPSALVVEVEDDGRGSGNGSAAVPDGHGLAGMRERAAALGGRLDAGAALGPGGGFRVHAWLPTGREDA